MTIQTINENNQVFRFSLARRIISLIMGLVTLIIGTALPILSGPNVTTAYVNVIWGSVYGLGFWIVSAIPSSVPGLFYFICTMLGMIAWPAVIVYTVYKSVSTVLSCRRSILIMVFGILFPVSFSWNMEIGKIEQSFVYYLPIYSAFMDR